MPQADRSLRYARGRYDGTYNQAHAGHKFTNSHLQPPILWCGFKGAVVLLSVSASVVARRTRAGLSLAVRGRVEMVIDQVIGAHPAADDSLTHPNAAGRGPVVTKRLEPVPDAAGVVGLALDLKRRGSRIL